MTGTNSIAKPANPDALKESESKNVQPLVDIYENQEEILLQVEMPGVERDNIKVQLDNGRLSLVARRSAASWHTPLYTEFGPVEYRRSFSVPQTIDGNKVKAELHDGVLHLHLPKSPAYKPRTIEIRQG